MAHKTVTKWRLLNSQFRTTIKDAVRSAKDGGKEICGLLVWNNFFVDIVKLNNKVKHGGGFSFYAGEVKRVQMAANVLDYKIIGTYHSHPLYIAQPGPSDIENASDDSYMLVIDVLEKEAKLWHVKNKKIRNVKYELI